MRIVRYLRSDEGQARWRFLLFLAAGGSAAVVNVLSRIVLNTMMSYEVAIVFAYGCGMTTAFPRVSSVREVSWEKVSSACR